MLFAEYVSAIVAWTFDFVRSFGALSVFFIVLLEEAMIPIPSPLVIMGAAYILIPQGIPIGDALVRIFILIVIPASLASAVGSYFLYGIGYYGGKPAINRMKRFGISWKDVSKYEKKLEKGKKTWVVITIGRAIPFFPVAIISVAAGVLRVSWKKYGLYTFIGSVPRTFILGFLGWYFGSSYSEIATKFNIIGNSLLIIIIGIAAFLIYRYRHHVKHHTKRAIHHAKNHYKNIKRTIS